MHRLLQCISIAFLSLLLGGCAGSADLGGWRRSVEKYVADRGQGDPSVLRGVTWPESRRMFSTLGPEDPAQGQDAKGLLIDVQEIAGKQWYIFMVGLVDRNILKDIRLAALSVENGKSTWRTSEADKKAFEQYRGYHDRLWRQRFPGRESPPAQYTTFPQEADTFAVQVNAAQLSATHRPSGARWELELARK